MATLCSPLLEALDRISGANLRHFSDIANPDTIDPDTIDPDTTYRTLRLPSGERLVANTQYLSAILTVNVGDEYLQLHQRFDAALLGRFDAQYTVERLDTETRTQILSPGMRHAFSLTSWSILAGAANGAHTTAGLQPPRLTTASHEETPSISTGCPAQRAAEAPPRARGLALYGQVQCMPGIDDRVTLDGDAICGCVLQGEMCQ